MTRAIWLPDATQISSFHEELTAIFATEDDPISPPGIKHPELLESAAHRPHTGLGSRDKYPSLSMKIAALFHSVAKNHAFHNGNKRTEIVTLLTTLYRNDRRFRQGVNDDAIYDLAVRVADDRFPTDRRSLTGDDLINSLSSWLDENTESLSSSSSSMKIIDFIEKCEEAGCRTKINKAGSRVIMGPSSGSVTVSGSTPELSRNVIRTYLKKLSLTSSASGILEEEFREGVSGGRQEMHRYMAALRRLAKT